MKDPKLVQIMPFTEDTFLALDSDGRLWRAEGIGSDRLSRPMVTWTAVRALFEDAEAKIPGDT